MVKNKKVSNKKNKNDTKEILVLFKNPVGKTGGELYNSKLFKFIEENSCYSIKYYNPKTYHSGISVRKLFAPLIELKALNELRNISILFMNSTMAYRHFLLLLCIRFFHPKKRVISIHHHFEFELMAGVKKILFKFFEINFLRLSSGLLLPSPYTRSRTNRLLPGKNIHYIELAFDKKLRPRNIKTDNEDFLYVGTIEKRKGLHLLIQALSQYAQSFSEFKLHIVGSIIDNDYYNDLIFLIKKYNLEDNIRFHGRVNDEELELFYSKAGLFLFPSLLEGYGMVIIEAMSFGIPVIAFNNSAIPFTVKDDYNGLLVDNRSVNDFSNAIRLLVSNPELRVKLSTGAHETFEKCRKNIDFEEDIKHFIEELEK